MVHKHGPCSKLKHHKPNPPSHAEILAQDESRFASIQSRLAKNLASQSNLKPSTKATLPTKSVRVLGSGNYMVTVGLGSPKKDVTLIFDTGSDFTWTQCQPCLGSCYNQQDPMFDPSASLSYANISCSSPSCQKLASSTATVLGCSTSTCLYGVGYSNSFSFGFFAKDKLTLTPTDVFDDFQFGCGQYNRSPFDGSTGFLGLGRNPLSFTSQTAQKYGKVFSYCLPSSDSLTGYLTFGSRGEEDSKRVKYTPSPVNPDYPSFYFLGMEGISVAGERLAIPTSVFSKAGTLIASGAVISRLPRTAYSALRKAFMEQMANYTRTDGVSIFDTCYDFSEHKHVMVPRVVLYFSDGVEMDLHGLGIIYYLNPSQVCLAFAGNIDDSVVSVIGSVQQKTFHVVYDDAQGRVGFATKGCN